jgi:putative colanic acid biosynthesis glycosyltransferase
VLQAAGHESFIAFGRGNRPSKSQLIRIGSKMDFVAHSLKSHFMDAQGFGSRSASKSLIRKVSSLRPDLIVLHNIHGYYLNADVLFNFLKRAGIPVVWTLHDCWAFTGHCAYYDFVSCRKWQTHCEACPLTRRYPRSLFFDNSWNNFRKKRHLFQNVPNLTLVTPSQWLKNQLEQSFLSEYPVHVIHNGIDLNLFNVLSQEDIPVRNKKVVLGVSNKWDRIKGLKDFIELRAILSDDYEIVLIGLRPDQIKSLPKGIVGIERTEQIADLVKWYNTADVLVNPTHVDNFPTINLEALACGTPVVTYDSGGSAEAVDGSTGIVVSKNDVAGLKSAIEKIIKKGRTGFQALCRERAERNFDKNDRFMDYVSLFDDCADSAMK